MLTVKMLLQISELLHHLGAQSTSYVLKLLVQTARKTGKISLHWFNLVNLIKFR